MITMGGISEYCQGMGSARARSDTLDLEALLYDYTYTSCF
jgi:hypothetical protein